MLPGTVYGYVSSGCFQTVNVLQTKIDNITLKERNCIFWYLLVTFLLNMYLMFYQQDLQGQDAPTGHEDVLEIITIIGLSLSIGGLTLTVLCIIDSTCLE